MTAQGRSVSAVICAPAGKRNLHNDLRRAARDLRLHVCRRHHCIACRHRIDDTRKQLERLQVIGQISERVALSEKRIGTSNCANQTKPRQSLSAGTPQGVEAGYRACLPKVGRAPRCSARHASLRRRA
jgi:hypothetical protein